MYKSKSVLGFGNNFYIILTKFNFPNFQGIWDPLARIVAVICVFSETIMILEKEIILNRYALTMLLNAIICLETWQQYFCVTWHSM